MNTLDIINKIATSNGLTTGRAEMIVSIVFEKISERLKKDGDVTINDFGRFSVEEKKNTTQFNDSSRISKKYIVFTPESNFLTGINS